MKYMLIAGEASGDIHASQLIRSITARDPEAQFRFIGGDAMQAEAHTPPILHYRHLNVMGFSAVIRKIPQLLQALKLAKHALKQFRPDRLILVDFPGFNLKMARYAHSLNIPTDWYIPPKIWAWKKWRLKKIKKYISNIYSILPFEQDFYRRNGFDRISYVGNPSVQEFDREMAHIPPLRHLLERQGIPDSRPIIAILPGSRLGEIRANLPIMLEAAKHYPDFQYIVAAAPNIPEKFYRETARDPGLQLVFGATTPLLKYAKAALVTSGTATLETALAATPQVVCYRANGSRLSYWLMKKLLHVRFVSLPNLIANAPIVPELLLDRCNTNALIHALTPLLQPSPKRDWQLNGYRTVKRRLGTQNAPDTAAALITSPS